MFGFSKKMIFPPPPTAPTAGEILADLIAAERKEAEGARRQQFGVDLRAATQGVRSMGEWLDRVAALEERYGMRVHGELRVRARLDAMNQVVAWLDGIAANARQQAKRHAARPSRIARSSLTQWRIA